MNRAHDENISFWPASAGAATTSSAQPGGGRRMKSTIRVWLICLSAFKNCQSPSGPGCNNSRARNIRKTSRASAWNQEAIVVVAAVVGEHEDGALFTDSNHRLKRFGLHGRLNRLNSSIKNLAVVQELGMRYGSMKSLDVWTPSDSNPVLGAVGAVLGDRKKVIIY